MDLDIRVLFLEPVCRSRQLIYFSPMKRSFDQRLVLAEFKIASSLSSSPKKTFLAIFLHSRFRQTLFLLMRKQGLQTKMRKFTLIELLVATAIVGMLFSMLVPGLAKAREAAKLSSCLNNAKQIGTAANLYALGHNGVLIGDSFGKKLFFANHYSQFLGGPDIGTLNNYVASAAEHKNIEAYQCPSTPYDDLFLDYTVNAIDLVKYANEGTYSKTLTINLDALPTTLSETVYVVEVNVEKMLGEGTPYSSWEVKNRSTAPFNHLGFPNTDPRAISSVDDKHLGKTVLNFFDGHSISPRLTSSGVPFQYFNPLDN